MTISSTLSDHDAARIAEHAAQAGLDGWLRPEQQALIHERGWLRMLAPRAVGGEELALPEVVRLEEAIARVDGSMGWTVTLCAGAGWFAGFLAPRLAREILAAPKVCLAGSGAPTGYADREDGEQAGWRITGLWDYASGAPMATHFTFNAILREGGQPLLDDAGAPRIQAFVVPAALVEIVPNWRSIGLRATASHAYRVQDRWVHAEHGFAIDPARATEQGPLYRFPFLPFAFVTLSANVAGMAFHFVELAAECIARRRNRFGGQGEALIEVPAVRALLDGTRAHLDEVRGRFYALLEATWAQVAAGAPVSAGEAAQMEALSMEWVAASRRAVDALYPYCGLYAAREDSPINRVWRDFHTASQHALLMPRADTPCAETGQTATMQL
ncbi:acyl-CoA dehydrogenase [Massilia sp. LXY-6]|uniref:acyl-CoA dehydrogenase n=1 Tax=Massilia sp. LXY-6 TaxID=3379823 RepID=UPI003EDEC97E